MSQFSVDIKKFVEKTGVRMDVAVRKISLDVHKSIVLETPVDTGRARANWQVGVNIVPRGTLPETDKTGSAALNKMNSLLAKIKGGDVVWIVNNVKYIRYLEEGSSQQAPAGMVRVALRNYPGIVEKAVQESKQENP